MSHDPLNPIFRHKGEVILERPYSLKDTRVRNSCAVGAFTYIEDGSVINKTSIGRYCSIARNTLIGPTSHPTDWFSTHLFVFTRGGAIGKSPEYKGMARPRAFADHRLRTVIGHDVWIGANVVIRRGVRVGNGAIIGAGAVVVKDVAPYEIVGGVPARHIRFRFDEALVRRMEAMQWWNYDLSAAVARGIDYSNPGASLDLLESMIASGELRPLEPAIERRGRGAAAAPGGNAADDEGDDDADGSSDAGPAPAGAPPALTRPRKTPVPRAGTQPQPIQGIAPTPPPASTARAEEITQLRSELKAAAARLSWQRDELEKRAQALAQAERQLSKTREMLSFQLGRALLDGTKSMKSFAQLPGQLLALRQEAVRRRAKRQGRDPAA